MALAPFGERRALDEPAGFFYGRAASGRTGREMPMFDLTGRKALVTGATGGIGGAIARALHGQGATVALSGTRRAALDELASALGERVHVVEANLSDKDAVEALVPAAEAAMEGLDILVNNAGVTRDNLFLRMKDEEWETVLAVNLTAAFRLSRAAVKGMMRRRYGRIVNIGSVVGATGNPGQGNYAASKAGLVGMTKALAAEVATRGITVNCVAPGMIVSPMTDALNEKQREAILGTIPMGRLGEGAEVAAAVAYLASAEAAYVTGQTIHVNGGMAMF
jgi:3-oxoacyl-[acyl-carrier protein] reductase